MRELKSQDLKAITEARLAPMVSIYLSKGSGPLYIKSLNEKWKESLKKAEFFLSKDYSRSFVDSFMEPLWADNCLRALEHLDKGIIVFYSAQMRGYLKVQTSLDDLVVVADSFHIKPLLRIKNTARGFFLVSICSKAIELLAEMNGHLYRLDTYRNVRIEALDFIAHTAVELNKMFSAYKSPIILAGVKEHLEYMRKFLDHSMLLDDSIVGNVERLKTDDLREKCFNLLEPYYFKKELLAIKELNLAVEKNYAITCIEDIAVSAVYGKIKKLFIVENRQLWGSINKLTGEINISSHQLNSRDDDILDDVCQIVLSKGGEVVVLKDSANVKGYLAAAIVTDRSHLYDFSQSYYSTLG